MLDRFLELGGVASQIGAELPHVREQSVLVREESLRSDLRGPYEVPEGQIEVRGSISHVGECRVEALELAEDQIAVGASVGLGEFGHVCEQVRQSETRERRRVQACGENVFD